MNVVASKQTSNGKLERLSPEELAELRRPATAKSIEESAQPSRRLHKGSGSRSA
jgi:hypothetical protein